MGVPFFSIKNGVSLSFRQEIELDKCDLGQVMNMNIKSYSNIVDLNVRSSWKKSPSTPHLRFRARCISPFSLRLPALHRAAMKP